MLFDIISILFLLFSSVFFCSVGVCLCQFYVFFCVQLSSSLNFGFHINISIQFQCIAICCQQFVIFETETKSHKKKDNNRHEKATWIIVSTETLTTRIPPEASTLSNTLVFCQRAYLQLMASIKYSNEIDQMNYFVPKCRCWRCDVYACNLHWFYDQIYSYWIHPTHSISHFHIHVRFRSMPSKWISIAWCVCVYVSGLSHVICVTAIVDRLPFFPAVTV